jgi:hypothetical protein
MERNARFLDLVGEHFVELDLDAGIAHFTGGRSYAFQVLGTESEHTLTWLWAWAEEQTEMPEVLTKASREMKVWLEQQGLVEYSLPSVDLDRADGMMFSLIGSDVCKADCYYREHYEGGALFILLYGTGLQARPVFTRRELVRTFEDLIDRYDVDHRNSLLSYYRGSGIDATITGRTISATLASGEHLITEFDASGRLVAVNGEKRG